MWIGTVIKCVGISLMVYGGYGILIEGYVSFFHNEKRGTFDPIRLGIHSLALGIGWGLILHGS